MKFHYQLLVIPEPIDTYTRSEAWSLGHGEVVVKIKGRTGGVCVSLLEIIEGRTFQMHGIMFGVMK